MVDILEGWYRGTEYKEINYIEFLLFLLRVGGKQIIGGVSGWKVWADSCWLVVSFNNERRVVKRSMKQPARQPECAVY